MKKPSIQEFFIGIFSAFTLIPILKWWGLALCLLCGVLWMAGGSYGKGIRRFCIPGLIFVTMISKISNFHWSYFIALGLGIAILHIGDGFPDRRPTTEDEGSWLGRQVERIIFPDIQGIMKYDQGDIDFGGTIVKWIIPVIFQVSLIPYWIGR